MVRAMSPRTIPLLAVLTLLTVPAAAAPARTVKTSPPVTVDTLLSEARAATARGETELALRLTQSAIVADPARASSYVALGDIYAEAGQAEYARSYYDEALDINPTEPSALKAIAALDGTHPSATAQAAQQAAQ
jgi:Flp pilus assembly protein TadD